VILLENRSPGKAISWIIVLILLPVIGFILYIFVGQEFRRRKMFSRKGIKKVYTRPAFALGLKELIVSAIPKHVQKTIHLLQKNSAAAAYVNTDVQLFTDGEKAFEQIFADIASARDHIHIEFYIIEDDEVGNRLRRLLIQKAKEHVQIRVIYDYLGSFRLSDSYLASLRNAGVQVQPFLPFNPRIGYSKINYRNHRKLIVIDGVIGFTGGLNIADRYLKGNRLGLWRDTQIRLEGPAVHGIQSAFLVDWYFLENKLLTDQRYYPEPKLQGQNVVQIVTSGPDTDWENILHGLVTIFSNAQKHIYIHTPYFLPPESLFTVLEIAAMSGVDVRLMLPEKSDTPLVAAASRSYLQKTLEAGIRVFIYQRDFLHSKAITIDDEISVVGTANMDMRSFEQNFEINAFIYDPKIASELKTIYKNDMKQCYELQLERWKMRKRSVKLKESIARLFSPLL
jgi:cardiolipin synthase